MLQFPVCSGDAFQSILIFVFEIYDTIRVTLLYIEKTPVLSLGSACLFAFILFVDTPLVIVSSVDTILSLGGIEDILGMYQIGEVQHAENRTSFQ